MLVELRATLNAMLRDSNFLASGGHPLLTAKMAEEIQNNAGLRLTELAAAPQN